MECEHRPATGNRAAEERKSEEPRCDGAADVKVHDVEAKPQEKPTEPSPILRVVDAVPLGFSMARDIDYLGGNAMFLQEPVDRHEIALDAAMGRGVGPELQHTHCCIVIQGSFRDR